MKKLLFLFVYLMLALASFAQQTTINGSKHPELIPDAAAAQAVFSVHSMLGASDIANTEKHHTKIKFSAADHAIYDAAMLVLHNNPRHFDSRAYQRLLSLLSVDGQSKLQAFIQAEKANMQYIRQEAIEQ